MAARLSAAVLCHKQLVFLAIKWAGELMGTAGSLTFATRASCGASERAGRCFPSHSSLLGPLRGFLWAAESVFASPSKHPSLLRPNSRPPSSSSPQCRALPRITCWTLNSFLSFLKLTFPGVSSQEGNGRCILSHGATQSCKAPAGGGERDEVKACLGALMERAGSFIPLSCLLSLELAREKKRSHVTELDARLISWTRLPADGNMNLNGGGVGACPLLTLAGVRTVKFPRRQQR